MAKHKEHDVLFFIEHQNSVEFFVPYNLKVWEPKLEEKDVVAAVVGEKYEYLTSVIRILLDNLERHIDHTMHGKAVKGSPELIKKLLATRMGDVTTMRRDEESLGDFLSRARKNAISQEVGVKTS